MVATKDAAQRRTSPDLQQKPPTPEMPTKEETRGQHGSKISVWIIYGLVVCYALCYQFQRPIEPFLVDRLVKGGGQDATLALGRVQAFFNMAQGVGSLMMGFILDRFGVKTGLVVNFLACALQYYILSVADSLPLLFLSKVPGMFMGGFLCAQTAIAKVTADGPERVSALGRLTSAYTVGGFLGPYLGGVLGSTGDYYLGAKLAVAGSLVSLLLVAALPTMSDTSKKDGPKDTQPWSSQARQVLAVAWPLLATKVVTGMANNMARTTNASILKDDFGFDEAKMGSMMSGQFAFGGFANAFLLAPLSKLLGGKMDKVVRNCAIVMGSVYLFQAVLFAVAFESGSVAAGFTYVGLSFFLALFQYSLATSITAQTQSLVPKSLIGTLMGIEHSIFAIAGMLGPILGTAAFQSSGLSGLSVCCGFAFFSTVLTLLGGTKSPSS